MLQKKCEKTSNEASCILNVEVANWKLKQGNIKEAKSILREQKDFIEKSDFVDNQVNSSYYEIETEYFRVCGLFNDHYKSSLLYLAYTPIESLSKDRKITLAYNLGHSALLGDQIYNFGELLQHPIIESLNGTEFEWLPKLLLSFNRGDLNEFKILSKDLSKFSKEIKNEYTFLISKLKLMSLLELVFNTTVSSRKIPFEDISKATDTKLIDVEELILSALAQNLIKGVIDEVLQTVTISWCQSRVLDISQISNVNKNITQWLVKVQNTLDFLEKEGSLKNE